MNAKTKKPSRMNTLLEAAAECFERNTSPFCNEWLVEHNVALDECDALSKSIGLAVKNWARLTAAESLRAAIRCAVDDPAERQRLLNIQRQSGAMREAREAFVAEEANMAELLKPYSDGYDDEPTCARCGGHNLEWETCHACGGVGEFDEHDDDPVNFAEGELMERCEECGGAGGYWTCHDCIREASHA